MIQPVRISPRRARDPDEAERRALAAVGEQEEEVFLRTMKKHTELFRGEIVKLTEGAEPI